MSSYRERYPIKPEQREAVRREIDRLIKSPPRPRTPDPMASSPETEAPKVLGSSVADAWMQLAIRNTGLTREQIVERWGEEAEASPVPSSAVPGALATQRAKLAKMPDLYRDAVMIREPRDCLPLQAVKKFLASRRRLLMLSGGKGTLKSGSACWAIGQVDGSRYVDAMELVDVHLRDPDRWASLLGGHLVVLDDLGREDQREGQWALFLAAWRKLVVNAYTRGRRLVVTSNLTWDQFRRDEDDGGYGALAADRWNECGSWIDVPGESQRKAMRTAPHWTDEGNGDG